MQPSTWTPPPKELDSSARLDAVGVSDQASESAHADAACLAPLQLSLILQFLLELLRLNALLLLLATCHRSLP